MTASEGADKQASEMTELQLLRGDGNCSRLTQSGRKEGEEEFAEREARAFSSAFA